MSWTILLILSASCLAMLILERLGVKTTLSLNFKGDVKRETRWFAQYGQGACTIVVAILIWQVDQQQRAMVMPLLIAVFGTSLIATIIKRLLGRVRPGREHAGQFLGLTLRHANWRESFPSSHSACAIALTIVLCYLYPAGSATFWTLGILCATLRYIMDAHWPSDVLGGLALGYGLAHLSWWLMVVSR